VVKLVRGDNTAQKLATERTRIGTLAGDTSPVHSLELTRRTESTLHAGVFRCPIGEFTKSPVGV
jgi:hypothetical protein